MIFQSIPRREAADGRLMTALAFSCALHALLLWPDVLPRASQPPGQLLTATLRATARADRPVVAALQAPPVNEAAKIRIVRRQAVVARAEPAPGHSRTPPENTGTKESVGVAAVVAGQSAFGSGPANPEAVAQAGELARPDADGIRAYRIGLAREARAYRAYPSLARERGWTGTAEVRVDVSRDGLPRQILLARSSGHDILDREAVNMMSRAASSAALPDSLRGRAFAVRLPVVFDIADAQ
jgi:protein TonB